MRTLGSVAIAGVGVLAIAVFGGGSDAVLAGYERDPEPAVGAVSLPAANRDTEAFAFKAEPGHLLLVNFGYTSCPDICPTTLADIRLAFADLGDRAADVNIAFVSIDPERDTADVLSNYLEAFLPDGVALRTDDPDQLAIAADAFGVTYFVGHGDNGEREDAHGDHDDHEVAHTPNVFVVDDTGSIVLTWPFGIPSADITSDLNILLDRRS